MTTYAAPINVKNAAIQMLGAKALVTELDQTKEARILKTHYEPTVKKWLTRHAWTWAMKSDVLVKSAETDTGMYVYTLPSDLLNLRYITYNDQVVDQFFEYEDGELIFGYDSTELKAHYTWRVPEARWPADFAEVVVRDLYGRMIRALLNDFNEARTAEQEAEVLARRAMVRDKRQIRGRDHNPNPRMVASWKGFKDGPAS